MVSVVSQGFSEQTRVSTAHHIRFFIEKVIWNLGAWITVRGLGIRER